MPGIGRILKKAGLGAAKGALGIGGGGLPDSLPESLRDELEEVIANGVAAGIILSQNVTPADLDGDGVPDLQQTLEDELDRARNKH